MWIKNYFFNIQVCFIIVSLLIYSFSAPCLLCCALLSCAEADSYTNVSCLQSAFCYFLPLRDIKGRLEGRREEFETSVFLFADCNSNFTRISAVPTVSRFYWHTLNQTRCAYKVPVVAPLISPNSSFFVPQSYGWKLLSVVNNFACNKTPESKSLFVISLLHNLWKEFPTLNSLDSK